MIKKALCLVCYFTTILESKEIFFNVHFCSFHRVSINSVTFPYIMEHISGVIVVSDKEIIAAMRMVNL